MKSQRIIDVVLIAIIAISVGFIGYRILGQKKTEGPETMGGVIADAKFTNSVPPRAPQSNLRGFKFQMNQLKIKPVTDEAWAKLVANPAIAKYRKKRTPGCDRPETPKSLAGILSAPELAKRFTTGAPVVTVSPVNRTCMETGTRLQFTLISDDPEAAYLHYVGSALLADVLVLTGGVWPDAVRETLGAEKADLLVQTDSGDANSAITITRFSEFKAERAPKSPLKIYLAPVNLLETDVLKRLMKSPSPPTVIDVRSASEFAKTSIAGSINIPYELKPNASSESQNMFSWNVLVKELATAKFEVMQILAKLNKKDGTPFEQPIIILGSGPTDGRPVWALNDIRLLGFKTVYWFFDGASAAKAAIGQP